MDRVCARCRVGGKGEEKGEDYSIREGTAAARRSCLTYTSIVLSFLCRASQEHPTDTREVHTLSIRTTREPHSRPRRCAFPAALPDVHVHACFDVVARFCPRPPDMSL